MTVDPQHRDHVGRLEAQLAAAEERSAGLEARLAEAERRLALLDEAVFDVIDELGRPGAPLHGQPHRALMRIFCKIDQCSEDFLDELDATPPDDVDLGSDHLAEPRLRVVPEAE